MRHSLGSFSCRSNPTQPTVLMNWCYKDLLVPLCCFKLGGCLLDRDMNYYFRILLHSRRELLTSISISIAIPQEGWPNRFCSGLHSPFGDFRSFIFDILFPELYFVIRLLVGIRLSIPWASANSTIKFLLEGCFVGKNSHWIIYRHIQPVIEFFFTDHLTENKWSWIWSSLDNTPTIFR